ncbi:MAG: MmgE/PrpD family protein [Syntrophorhabdaceae bacterium]|nr:MmgE/PrpD family protein [Syntrophorhabdaceae bacterium]
MRVGYTEDLSRFVSQCGSTPLTQEVVDGAKRCFLDWIGVTIGAATESPVMILLDVVLGLGGKKQASILGHRIKTSMVYAALVNGTMSHTLDYDDAHSVIRTHPSAPLIPALLALAEHYELSGMELINAFAAGYETTVRMGYALGKEYYERGWHSTSVLGRLGAAAGAARLLRLEPEKTAAALGLAATQAGGVRDVFGTMGKPFHAGKAAMDGLLAALLAKEGFTAPVDMLDKERGFPRVFTSEYQPEWITGGLGKEYRLGEVNFKPYAACLLVHPVVDAMLAIRRDQGPRPGEIEKIDIRVAPLNLKVTGKWDPRTEFEAKFSLPAAAALALIYGNVNNSLFTDSVVHDPLVRAIMDKVKATVDASMAETEAVVNVLTKDGQRYTSHVTSPKGDPENPMSFSELEAKVRDLTEKALSRNAINSMIGMVAALEKLENTAELIRLCRPRGGRGMAGLTAK